MSKTCFLWFLYWRQTRIILLLPERGISIHLLSSLEDTNIPLLWPILGWELAQIFHERGTQVYIDDILVGVSDVTTEGQTQTNIITHRESLGLQFCRERVQLCSSGVKFLLFMMKSGRSVYSL